MRARLLALAVAALCCGCGGEPPPPPPRPSPAAPTFFSYLSKDAGITFAHSQSRNHEVLFLPETLGPGVASFDYDGDGLQDLFFVQGSGHTDGKDPATVPACHLYRNVANGSNFDETGEVSGAALKSWGQAVLACDWNNDGYPDLVITGYHEPLALLTNQGDGTFKLERGVRGLPGGDRWWSSITAVDLDRDGLLDLYAGAYVKFGDKDWVENPPSVDYNGMSLPRTMAPSPYDADANAFLANRGDGRWEDRTARLGLANEEGRTLAAMAADLDQDGWADLFVANDVSACALFHNVRGAVEDVAARAWVAESRGSMGLALTDVDGDGGFDIGCSHWVGDIPALYRNTRPGGGMLAYQDLAGRSGLANQAKDRVGWAIAFRDFDNDGHDDMLIVNGHTSYVESKGKLVAQTATFMTGQGGGKFVPVQPPGPLSGKRVGRGAAFTDLDNDGYEDVAVGVNNGPAEVWRNGGGKGHWIGLELAGTRSNRNAIGAIIDVASPTSLRHAQITSGESFFSCSDARVLFGLGMKDGTCRVRVRWPSGLDETFDGLTVDRYHRLSEGAGAGR